MKNVHIVKHPLVLELVTKLRNVETESEKFRQYTKTISTYLLYEAMRETKLQTKSVHTQTKGVYKGHVMADSVKFYGILREGIGMLASPLETFPGAQFDLIGVKRNDEDPFGSPATLYFDNFSNLSRKITRVVLMDQMFATGGTILAVLDSLIKKYKFKGRVDIVSVIVAVMGAKRVLAFYPNVHITCAGLDAKLTRNGYIYPGLGDAADRYFHTLK